MGLDHETESLYTVRMPAQHKYDQNNTVMDLSTVSAHEALHREFEEQPELACAIDTVAGSAEWTPTYCAHPVVACSDGCDAPHSSCLIAFPLHQRRRHLADHHVQLVDDAASFACGSCPFQDVSL